MFFCENCGRDHTNRICPRCGVANSTRPADEDDRVSDPGDSLDTMIEQASRPTLASLLKRGIANGTITPSHEYSAGDVRSS